jgi:hypothetical protein
LRIFSKEIHAARKTPQGVEGKLPALRKAAQAAPGAGTTHPVLRLALESIIAERPLRAQGRSTQPAALRRAGILPAPS